MQHLGNMARGRKTALSSHFSGENEGVPRGAPSTPLRPVTIRHDASISLNDRATEVWTVEVDAIHGTYTLNVGWQRRPDGTAEYLGPVTPLN